MIDRTATFVARSANPPQFEEKIRENQRQDPKFAFLNPADPYHAYYRHRMDKVVRGEVEETPAQGKEGEKEEEKPVETAPVDMGEEPPIPEFIMSIPNITAIDLCVSLLCSYMRWTSVARPFVADAVYSILIRDIIKLTALFTARRGRPFLAALSAREGRNYQFDFLRPTHSLFGYFNRLVDQYSKVLLPSKEMLAQLKDRAHDGARWKDLEVAKRRARWEQVKREQDKKREDDKEAERSACLIRSPSHGFADLCLKSRLRRLIGTTMPSCRRSNSLLPMRLRSCRLQ